METKNKRMSLGKKELAPFGIDINDKGRVLRALVDQQKINDIEKKIETIDSKISYLIDLVSKMEVIRLPETVKSNLGYKLKEARLLKGELSPSEQELFVKIKNEVLNIENQILENAKNVKH